MIWKSNETTLNPDSETRQQRREIEHLTGKSKKWIRKEEIRYQIDSVDKITGSGLKVSIIINSTVMSIVEQGF